MYYGILTDLIDCLEEAQTAGRLNHRLKTLTHPALLVADEIGYLPVSRSGAILFFQLVNRRYEHASTVLTSNQGFERWGEILHDEVMAAATARPAPPPLSHRQHPRQQLPHATPRRTLQGDPSDGCPGGVGRALR